MSFQFFNTRLELVYFFFELVSVCRSFQQCVRRLRESRPKVQLLLTGHHLDFRLVFAESDIHTESADDQTRETGKDVDHDSTSLPRKRMRMAATTGSSLSRFSSSSRIDRAT